MKAKFTFFILFLSALSLPAHVFAYPRVILNSWRSVPLDGPAHHGFALRIHPVNDPNLTHFEVELKPEGRSANAPWPVYNANIPAYASAIITIPYRSDAMALMAAESFCVRIRAVYDRPTAWAEQCGLEISLEGDDLNDDRDGDGLSNADEFALGTDWGSADTDGDGTADNREYAHGTDPNRALFPHLLIHTPRLDFGLGYPNGRLPNQHQNIVIENRGDDVLTIEAIVIHTDGHAKEAASFKIGPYPRQLSHIPPQSILRLPISFLPQLNGALAASVIINHSDGHAENTIPVTGLGREVPPCEVEPDRIDFANLSLADSTYSVKRIRVSNLDNEDGGFAFGLSATHDTVIPGLRNFTLPSDRYLDIPILFKPSRPGSYAGDIIVKSVPCGEIRVPFTGRAQ